MRKKNYSKFTSSKKYKIFNKFEVVVLFDKLIQKGRDKYWLYKILKKFKLFV